MSGPDELLARMLKVSLHVPPESRIRTIAELQADNAALAARCEKLAEIEHLVWHCLDDSEERDGEQVITHNDDFRKLVSLLSEDHPTTAARGALASQAEGESANRS